MYRPQSLEVSNRSGVRYLHVVPQYLSDEKSKVNIQLQNLQKMNMRKNWPASGEYVPHGNISYHRIDNVRHQWLPRKVDTLDYQISHLIQESDSNAAGRICQSQSFSEGPFTTGPTLSYRENPAYVPLAHTSRLSACMYMSPPPPQWIPVGNIMSVKRSTSMPGSRPNSVSIPSQLTERGDCNQSSIKKKCGPFQCLKHQFRRSIHKDNNMNSENRNSLQLTDNKPADLTKTSKSMFKKRPITVANNDQISSSKSKGIRKSISLLFSKSHRSSKSDPSIMNKKPITETQQQHSSKDTNITYQHASRRNRSYESMLDSGEMKLSNETNKSCSYSDVQDSSSSSLSIIKTKAAVSVDLILCQRSPSETSLSDSVASVSSSENQLSSQIASCHRNINYRTEDNGWKTVVGNVCRSNSKDSAIANSTLSGDGMINQSKRVSLTSTISRTSDITTTSEDFNDSSYSSFNDLQTNFSQYSYSKPRLISGALSNLEPIKVNCDTTESDISPSSDSSTETLRPLSSIHRRRYRSSHSNVITIGNHLSPIVNDLKQKCLKRSHSWPGCHFHLLNTEINFDSKPITKSPIKFAAKSTRYPKLKMSYIQQSHLNSSPLLSQYSRLYSLRTSALNDQRSRYCLSSQLSSTTQAPMSPINYSNFTDPVFLRAHHVRQSKN